jgi:hypothetical protein
MFPALILALSVGALSQFAVFYWRAVLIGVAATPISDETLEAAGLKNRPITGQDFATVAGLRGITPELRSQKSGLGFVGLHYHLVQGICWLVGRRVPSVATWGERELATCARYALVEFDRRLQSNVAMAAALRSN